MKNILILLFICLSFSNIKAQNLTNYADTANYLIQQIENKKALFVNKPLSVLLDSLKIQPVDAYTGATRLKSDFGKRLRFQFNNKSDFNKKHFVIVKFDNIPSYQTLFPLLYPSSGERAGLQVVKNIYNLLIVKDVSVKDYTNDEPVNPGIHY